MAYKALKTRRKRRAKASRKIRQRGGKTSSIPIIVICWNNLTFIKGFVNQIKKYNNPIILLDNNSQYQPLLKYYIEIKEELKDKITIRLLDKNYGHEVYIKLKHTLPDVYILSDPDLELNANMPHNFVEIFLELSHIHKANKVGSAIKIEDNHAFVKSDKYFNGKSIREWESQFWKNKIDDSKYELYRAQIDTTFCLVNNAYGNNNIRVAGDFTVKHLPWYKDYIKSNIPREELKFWKQNNASSTILRSLNV